jgi:LCP family protein required for cell wall assembly
MSRHHKNKKTIIMEAVFICVLLIVAAIVLLMAVFKNQNGGDIAETDGTVQDSGFSNEKWQEGDVRYNGSVYQYNTAIKTYLIMGIDVSGPVIKAADGISGGQSDAMFLLVCDSSNNKMSLIAINRNTMTDIDVYNEDWTLRGTYKLQICLQHAYGDGMRVSCIRSVDAVSHLFYDVPISGYVSMNLDGIPILNDSVGGVTLEVMQDLQNTSKGVDLHKGDMVTLNGNEAYVYLRSRDTNVFASANDRLERQIQYMGAYYEKAKLTINDSDDAMDIYDSLEDYLVTSVDFSKLVDELMQYELDESNIYSVQGETVQGKNFEEFYVDDTALYELILDVFYNEVEEG